MVLSSAFSYSSFFLLRQSRFCLQLLLIAPSYLICSLFSAASSLIVLEFSQLFFTISCSFNSPLAIFPKLFTTQYLIYVFAVVQIVNKMECSAVISSCILFCFLLPSFQCLIQVSKFSPSCVGFADPSFTFPSSPDPGGLPVSYCDMVIIIIH